MQLRVYAPYFASTIANEKWTKYDNLNEISKNFEERDEINTEGRRF